MTSKVCLVVSILAGVYLLMSRGLNCEMYPWKVTLPLSASLRLLLLCLKVSSILVKVLLQYEGVSVWLKAASAHLKGTAID